MNPAQQIDDEKDIKVLDTLSGLLVLLFTFFLLLFYSFPLIQAVEGEMLTPSQIEYPTTLSSLY